MHPRMILTIFRKDVRDAIRDARVVVAVLVPLAIGVSYNFLFNDDPVRPGITIAYSSAGQTALPDALRKVAGQGVTLELVQVPAPEEVRRLVDDEDADLGLIVPAGFDAALRGGAEPELTVVRPAAGGFGANYAAVALESALGLLTGSEPPVMVQTEVAAPVEAGQDAIDRLGLRRWAVLASAMLLIAMISMLAVPVILAEEAERKTLDALTMIASYADVIAAKALVGLCYVLVAVPLLLGLTRLGAADEATFVAVTLALSLALIGFGLLLGGLFRSANQLNTWSGFLLLPMTAPIFMVGLPVPDAVDAVLTLLPTSQAMRLAMNAQSGEALFPDPAVSFLVIALWAVLAYGLLLWRLSRREA